LNVKPGEVEAILFSLPGQPLSSAFHAGRLDQIDRPPDNGLGGTVGLREQPVDLVWDETSWNGEPFSNVSSVDKSSVCAAADRGTVENVIHFRA
jgi:hypothetical protein